jgi:hypothetical protein
MGIRAIMVAALAAGLPLGAVVLHRMTVAAPTHVEARCDDGGQRI